MSADNSVSKKVKGKRRYKKNTDEAGTQLVSKKLTSLKGNETIIVAFLTMSHEL
jgi:hypothetical protein